MYTTANYKTRNFLIWLAVILEIVVVGLFLYFYQFDPFPEGVVDLVTTGMTAGAAVAAAVVGTMVWGRYGKQSPPRIIWMHFTLALWGWAIAEVIWVYEFATDGNYLLGPADVLWVISYFFFIAALYSQYALIYRPSRRVGIAYIVLSILAVFLFTYLYARWLTGSGTQQIMTETLVNAFYALGDIALAVASLWLAYTFRNGALGRPWLGLVIFSFSDLLYAWLESSGLYAWSVAEGNFLTTVTDATYLSAYLVVAFGCYLQWILLTYGPRLKNDQ